MQYVIKRKIDYLIFNICVIRRNHFTHFFIPFTHIFLSKLAHDLPDDGQWEPVKLSNKYDASKPGKGVIIGWGRLWVRFMK